MILVKFQEASPTRSPSCPENKPPHVPKIGEMSLLTNEARSQVNIGAAKAHKNITVITRALFIQNYYGAKTILWF